MADWKKLLKDVLLADGSIDATETNLLRAELFADGVIDADEKAFLVALKSEAKEVCPEFEKLCSECIK